MATYVTPARKEFLRENVFVTEMMHVLALFPNALPILTRHGDEAGGDFNDLIQEFAKETILLQDPDEMARWLAPLWTAKTVDNFNCYLADVLSIVFRRCPETLKCNKTVTFEQVLDCESLDEVLQKLASLKVEELAYNGFEEMWKYLKDRVGIQVDLDEANCQAVGEAIAIRNIVVHNRGRVNARFLKETRLPHLAHGDRFSVKADRLNCYLNALEAAACRVDEEVIQKFKLTGS